MTIKWVQATEERYWDMLGVLPPASQAGLAFQVGEATDHRNGRPTFATFKEEPKGTFWESDEPVTFQEFKKEFPEAIYCYE